MSRLAGWFYSLVGWFYAISRFFAWFYVMSSFVCWFYAISSLVDWFYFMSILFGWFYAFLVGFTSCQGFWLVLCHVKPFELATSLQKKKVNSKSDNCCYENLWHICASFFCNQLIQTFTTNPLCSQSNCFILFPSYIEIDGIIHIYTSNCDNPWHMSKLLKSFF